MIKRKSTCEHKISCSKKIAFSEKVSPAKKYNYYEIVGVKVEALKN